MLTRSSENIFESIRCIDICIYKYININNMKIKMKMFSLIKTPTFYSHEYLIFELNMIPVFLMEVIIH